MTITLIENFRCVFYTPFYAPVALGTYAAEGLDVRIRTSPAAEQTIHALVAGEGEVSWGGLSRLMGMLEKGPADPPVAFCEVIARDPFFLIGREPNPDFAFRDLIGKKVAIVSEVPAPWMCLQYDLKCAGIDWSEIERTPDGTMAQNVEAFRGGDIDVVQVFHPYAHALTASGAGHVWYAAAKRGLASYTTLNTTRGFARREPDVLVRMCRAVYRAQQWIASNSGSALAEVVAEWFPGTPREVLGACFDDYKRLGVWSSSPLVSHAGFDFIRDAGLSMGRVRKRFEFDDCVDTRFAKQAMRGEH